MPKVSSGEELEKIQAQLKELHMQRPHGDLYEKVLEVRAHVFNVNHQVSLCKGWAAQILGTDAEKKSAEEGLRKLLRNIPHPEL